ncbi:MAG TPA: flavodoxin-dependent (E)-4-hydroxy-3-methylbut-2-enyl-diphosphate synthase [Persephonella sp.]|uniref:4-hydroxy-3-methylbut-2-en-1-yl diphosphate synthase (flavodoxin) n=1 Tax=Persephonella marina (strain DSM 14350 / EX-H1) TaxID=123214 RepID=ISPG_PERMH|nr:MULTISPECIES: flavodoxin-dependent (E)-4-hydroxy-3-methylbut-2-enyl-diphosphate synthase [Persephonella]C0QRI5.1 RecName: Full=4-hydroxy-3-methylbut-2-en-1-yl diphosphate synthase (flavodoxin); AltName: Full=1-hydroxy-2-methyl-2-(E)-butenyl 4-diphosphate synthase [Persephonella marina EX-H1]ACO03666.1 4-hydroxy-3-methylbut-2-en-1-yl diphosphate synthase [Persephonella marina EX-H1]HCB69026.1 flavodoxin-dependent (E)-4-hydroxy-3-methylbut-2-enyl-diphosphate synthase [Persephonella sp.]
MIKRRKTREIDVGGVKIGGDNPVVVQSMTDTKTHNIEETLSQIKRLADAGCEIIRVAVPTEKDAEALKEIVKRSPIPVIADIHFSPRIAFTALESGIHGIRLNPGNINDEGKIREILQECKKKNITVRLGVNSGSLEMGILEKYGFPSGEALAESALNWSEFFEKVGFTKFKVSIKGSDVLQNIEANKIFAEKTDIPLHIGITEAGPAGRGSVKSAVGLGILLYMGIGDTVRVSLTADPEEEVKVAYQILQSLGLRRRGIEIVSCPTCGRIEVNLPEVVRKVEEKLDGKNIPIKVAIMGCVVNAIGEAREADIGLACGNKSAILFKKGEPVKRVSEDQMIDQLLKEIDNLEI